MKDSIAARTVVKAKPAYTSEKTKDQIEESKQTLCSEKNIDKSIAEQIACNGIFYVHYPWTKAPVRTIRAEFYEVDKFFPTSIIGPVYMDEPKNEEELKTCLEKQKEIEALGLRYLIIDHRKTREQILEQLSEEELKRVMDYWDRNKQSAYSAQ